MIRDYIPAGDKLSVAEESKLRGRSRRPGEGIIPDFVPTRPAVETPPYMERVKAAQDRLVASAQKSSAELYERAVEKMAKLDAKAAVAFLEKMPTLEREVHLLAEENYAARKTVLKAFPPIGDSVRERYAPKTQEEPNAD